MKTYQKKNWEKPNVSNLSIKSLTLSGQSSNNVEVTAGSHGSPSNPNKRPS